MLVFSVACGCRWGNNLLYFRASWFLYFVGLFVSVTCFSTPILPYGQLTCVCVVLWFTARTETGHIRQTQASCPYGRIGVLKQVTDTNRTTKYKNQEARKYRRSFPHLHPHATLNTSHQYSAGKNRADNDIEITTFQHYTLTIYFIYSFNFCRYL
jgi:hypothetical protein